MSRQSLIGEEMKNRIVELTLNGHRQKDIAHQTGYSLPTIRKIQKERCCEPLWNSKSGAVPNFVKKEPKLDPVEHNYTLINNKTLEVVGIGTQFVYTVSTKGKDLTINTGYCPEFAIDLKDLVNFANELMDVAQMAEQIRSNKFSV